MEEHDEIMLLIGQSPEGDGQEHDEIMKEILYPTEVDEGRFKKKSKGKIKNNTYWCKHCKRSIKRKSNKQWIKSFCERTGKNTHITKFYGKARSKKN